MRESNSYDVFFSLLRAGLWENKVRLASFSEINIDAVFRDAEDQSVVGLIAAGLEYVVNKDLAKQYVLRFIGQAIQIEHQNTAMNLFIGVIVDKMWEKKICPLLIKGQGVAQCYERPHWRSCGDIDFLLSKDDYKKAKELLVTWASKVEGEGVGKKHCGMTIGQWIVELHGSLRSGLSRRIDKGLSDIQKEILVAGKVRIWTNGNTHVRLPNVEEDAIYIFTHILGHFYKGGIGLRQICDWCRLLWTYKESLNHGLLESRIRKMGLVSEWKVFGAFAVDYLGMPSDAMPLYSSDKKWSRKADMICAFVMEVGNFGHNRDNSYYAKYPFLIRKIYSLGRRCGDLVHHARIFPMDSLRFFPYMMYNGLKAALSGEVHKYVQEV